MPSNVPILEQWPIQTFTEKAYLDYSMYVILDRALPFIGDGLKPVQRRIIFAMSELGLKSTAKYKKSARTVGDVLGKFHPHGDSACYEAMVLMAQDFSYRYPFVDGQGNWGSPDDPKSFAAMRYTESRLSAYADLLLSELGEGTVKWTSNFDGTLEEPESLPARIPNILLNGGSGIAVGMATDIPPHNLREIVNACIHLIDHPQASLLDLSEFIQGPDYPTEAEIITPKAELWALYQKGQGSIRQRAIYQIEKGDIVITALPFQVSGAKILEQIAEQMQAKKCPMIVDLRDESDHENPTRLVLILKSNRVDIESLMSHLFATTDLERSYRANLNMIGIDGKPQVKSLDRILSEWLLYRSETVKRRLQFRLEKILNRLHLLEGFLIAYLNIDEVIAIIRQEEDPKAVLIARFGLSAIQADAILDMKLRYLGKLEEIKIRGEQEILDAERLDLEGILASPTRLKNLLKRELKEDAKNYGDSRRSPIVSRKEAKALSQEEIIPSEIMTVILSEMGWVRAAKGADIDPFSLNYRAGDAFKAAVTTRSNQSLIVLDSSGRAYGLPVHGLPSARSQGEPLTSRLKPPAGAQFEWILAGDIEGEYLMVSDAAYGFIVHSKDLEVKNKVGKALMTLPKNSRILRPLLIKDRETQILALGSSEGRVLLFPLKDLPLLSKGKGNKLIQIPTEKAASREELLVAAAILDPKQSLLVKAQKRELILKPTDLKGFYGDRGRRGTALPRAYLRLSELLPIDR